MTLLPTSLSNACKRVIKGLMTMGSEVLNVVIDERAQLEDFDTIVLASRAKQHKPRFASRQTIFKSYLLEEMDPYTIGI